MSFSKATELTRSLRTALCQSLFEIGVVLDQVRERKRHRQLDEDRVTKFFEQVPLAALFAEGIPTGKKSAPRRAGAQ